MSKEIQNKIIINKIQQLILNNTYFNETELMILFINHGDKYASTPEAADMNSTAAIKAKIYRLKKGMIG